MLLELPTQVDLGAVFAHRAIVHQKEVRMKAVEDVELAERVEQRLVRSDDLRRGGREEIRGKGLLSRRRGDGRLGGQSRGLVRSPRLRLCR